MTDRAHVIQQMIACVIRAVRTDVAILDFVEKRLPVCGCHHRRSEKEE